MMEIETPQDRNGQPFRRMAATVSSLSSRWSAASARPWATACVECFCPLCPVWLSPASRSTAWCMSFPPSRACSEDVTEIVLNLKGVAAKIYGESPKTVRVEAVGPCEVTAGSIKAGDDLEILNPEWHIATLGEGAKLVMELTFDKGRGYVPAERNKQALIEKNDISTLPVDSIYTPVLKANYTVESTRVGQITDYDKLTIEVWTDGTINAQEAAEPGGPCADRAPEPVCESLR